MREGQKVNRFHRPHYRFDRVFSTKRKKPFSDWRSNLYTMFVENISCRISKSALCDSFSVYGRVVDVYILLFNKDGKVRPVTFAFVRFKYRFELDKTIREGNNRKMDGRFIRVKEASISKSMVGAAKSINPHSVFKDSDKVVKRLPLNLGLVNDGVSYKDALAGVNTNIPLEASVYPTSLEVSSSVERVGNVDLEAK
ncbi:hypothetical protein REPUB_Repub06bG0149800 [Reevesia pubescens]